MVGARTRCAAISREFNTVHAELIQRIGSDARLSESEATRLETHVRASACDKVAEEAFERVMGNLSRMRCLEGQLGWCERLAC